MREKRRVSMKDVVNDIRAGMADPELMTKYNLSARGLQRTFEKLVAAGAIAESEIEGRFPSTADSLYFENMRELPRHYLVIPIPIYELGRPADVPGKLRDVTEKGVGVIGVKAKVGETKVFAIYPNEFVTVSPFSFEAVCRWNEESGIGDLMAGFEITRISDESLEKLRQLIEELTFGQV
jgi:hypothetical protein